MTEFLPEAGDLIWKDFDPTLGAVRAEHRLAQAADVLPESRFCLFCPNTSHIRPFPTSVVFPD